MHLKWIQPRTLAPSSAPINSRFHRIGDATAFGHPELGPAFHRPPIVGDTRTGIHLFRPGSVLRGATTNTGTNNGVITALGKNRGGENPA